MSLDNKIITRRDFLNGAAALTASGLLVPISTWAAEDAKQTRVIPVVKDMTGNLVMGYIARQAGIDLKKYVTDDARKYMTLTFGEKSPKTIWVGANLDNVILSDQIAWRTSEAGVKSFSKKMKVERTPKNLDYLFPGDSLVLDLSRMKEEDRAKVIAKFGDKSINITRKELLDYAEKAYGGRVKQQKTAIAKLKDIDPKRVERYTNMDTLEFMVRAVEPGVGDSMYKGLVEQGVKFESPAGYIKAAEGVSGPEHRARDPKLAQFYLGFSFMRPGETTPRSIGIVPPDPGAHYDLQLRLEQDEIKKILGEKDYALIEAKSQKQRTLVRSAVHDVAYVAFVRQIFDTLAPKAETIDTRTGNVTNAIKASTYLQDHPTYTFRAVVVQKVAQN